MSDLIEQVARKYALKYHLSHYVQGDDGYGGEDEPNENAVAAISAALRELSAKLEGSDTRWEDWRKQLLDAWAKDHRATMTALLEGGPANPPETTNG